MLGKHVATELQSSILCFVSGDRVTCVVLAGLKLAMQTKLALNS